MSDILLATRLPVNSAERAASATEVLKIGGRDGRIKPVKDDEQGEWSGYAAIKILTNKAA
jgi:hypothetical protein